MEGEDGSGQAGVPHRYISRYVLLKLAARCNLNCTYCYWFRDTSVYEKPAVLTPEAEGGFLRKLAAHVERYELDAFSILFHGGEPLLFGKRRFEAFVTGLRELERRLGFKLKLDITTNGTLLDREWAALFRTLRVRVTISVDGPRAVHDRNRLDFKGRGSYDRVVSGLATLREAGIEPGVLAVCDPTTDPEELASFFVDDLGVDFDVLVPDATHEDAPPSIAAYYTKLFDLWYDRYAARGVRIRFLDSVSRGLLGIPTRSESIGYGAITTMTMLTDGSLEALDILRTARFNITRSEINVLTHELQDIELDPVWREVLHASLHLAHVCRACPYELACGGGHIASRWSQENRYDNPSVYCEDFKQILSHAWTRISQDLYVETPTESVPFLQALTTP